MANETTVPKRPRVANSTFPDKTDSLIQELSVLVPRCKKACRRKSEVLQCNLCAVWVHARCEGVSSESEPCIL